ncbi:thioredoxin-like protein [Stemphylium lycopersici]|nr:thioredoxin-like protein [Stemphylium lycopersici]RAR07730.1 thioredoxin-like protein [Stemphylium lycopersici]
MFNSLGTKLALRKAGLGNVSLPKTDGFFGGGGGGNTKKGSSNGAEGGDTGFANPFTNVQWSVPKALQSWTTPPPPQNPVHFAGVLETTVAEKLFLRLRTLANRYPSIRFIAISHCTPAATKTWLDKLGSAQNVDVIVDAERDLYALWGLGISTWSHVLHPRNGYNQVMLRKNEGVWGQQVGEGACRWQLGGAYAVDGRGVVTWGGPMDSVDEEIRFDDGVKTLGFGEARIWD